VHSAAKGRCDEERGAVPGNYTPDSNRAVPAGRRKVSFQESQGH